MAQTIEDCNVRNPQPVPEITVRQLYYKCGQYLEQNILAMRALVIMCDAINKELAELNTKLKEAK